LANWGSAPVRSRRCRRRNAVVAEIAGEFFNVPPYVLLSSRCDAERTALVRNMLFSALPMDAAAVHDRSPSFVDAENWLALSAGALLLLVGASRLLLVGASRRSAVGACLAVSSAPLLYRGVTGRWPDVLQPDSTRTALGGDRGVHVRESIRLEVPVADVYRFWRRLDNLPRFMTHLDRVTEGADGRSHWVTSGPAGLAVEWDAEIINEVENRVLAWRSLPGSDVVTAAR
jgi:uncharacterized membrane protein